MPATAGRVRMPANNRVHSSAALQTHGIWQSAIGYDPYAPSKEEKTSNAAQKSSVAEPDSENAYASFQGLLALARITGSNADEARGSCKKCGRVGHLTFQCRNFLSAKNEDEKKDSDIQAAVLSGLEKLKGERVKLQGKNGESGESSEEDESESSDSEFDSEIERAIAEKYGKRFSGGKSGKSKSDKSRKRSDSDESDDDDGSERDSRVRRKRGRSKKRRSSKREESDSDEEDAGRKKRKEKRRRRDDDDSSEEEEERKRRRRKSRKEKRRRRSHRHSDDESSSDDSVKERRKRRSRRAGPVSDSDGSGSDDARVGRDKKRSVKKSRKHRHDKD